MRLVLVLILALKLSSLFAQDEFGEDSRVENQSELESENNPQLATTLAQQKMLYSEIKKLSSNLVANQDALKVKLLAPEKRAMLKRHTNDAEAYQLYLRGRYFFYNSL